MEADLIFDTAGLERLQRALAKRKERICERIATLAEQNARQYARGETPDTFYEASIDELAQGQFKVTLEVNPRNDHADLIFRIAVGGRKAYTISARRKGALAWEPSGAYQANSRTGRYVRWVPKDIYAQVGPSSSQVQIPAKPATLDPNFVNAALRNAVARVRNDYR